MSASELGVPKVPTGIAGLDEMLQGGFPAGHVVLVTGLPGTGKTCLSLQFLLAGAQRGEKGVFLSLEEDVAALTQTARQFGWPVDDALKRELLKIIRLDPKETKQNIQRIQGELGKELKALGAKRIVVDSVSLLNMLSDDEAGRRATLFSLAAACRSAGATTVLTAEADPTHPGISRDGLSEYVSDGVVVLTYTTAADGHRVGLSIRVLKMRRTPHLRSVQPYVIGLSGLRVDAKAIDLGGV
ncbi:MAG: AAA family ATPase [Thermoplasmata archaeon]|nr:AAA family ATPase [Thermoplasmata archaeon]